MDSAHTQVGWWFQAVSTVFCLLSEIIVYPQLIQSSARTEKNFTPTWNWCPCRREHDVNPNQSNSPVTSGIVHTHTAAIVNCDTSSGRTNSEALNQRKGIHSTMSKSVMLPFPCCVWSSLISQTNQFLMQRPFCSWSKTEGAQIVYCEVANRRKTLPSRRTDIIRNFKEMYIEMPKRQHVFLKCDVCGSELLSKRVSIDSYDWHLQLVGMLDQESFGWTWSSPATVAHLAAFFWPTHAVAAVVGGEKSIHYWNMNIQFVENWLLAFVSWCVNWMMTSASLGSIKNSMRFSALDVKDQGRNLAWQRRHWMLFWSGLR